MTTNNAPAPAAPSLRAASTHPCACGCGQVTGGDWAPGHDGRAKGLLRSVARGERTAASLPGQLAALLPVLVARWGLGSVEQDGAISWSEAARAPTTKRPAASHPAMRTLLRARDQLADKPDLAELIGEVIEALQEANG